MKVQGLGVKPASARRNGRNGNLSWWQRFGRLCRYRLIVPIQRSIHSPEQIARGVMVGLAWGLTPTIGLQMGLCFLTWLFTVRVLRWHFNIVIAMAWTWTTNVLTMVPAYYLFYQTGQLMLGRFGGMTGYGEFVALWDKNMASVDGGFWQSLSDSALLLLQDGGLPMVIGCLPWAALGAWAGYVWTLRFATRYQQARHRRHEARRARREAAAAGPAESQ